MTGHLDFLLADSTREVLRKIKKIIHDTLSIKMIYFEKWNNFINIFLNIFQLFFHKVKKKTLSIMLCVLKRRVHKIQNFNEEITTLSPLCKHVNCYLTCNCIESVYSMPKFMFRKSTNKSDSVGVSYLLFKIQQKFI